MKKKISLLLVAILIMVNISVVPTWALSNEENYAGNQLHTLGLLKGYPDGTLGLEKYIVRAEVTALVVRALGYKDKDIPGQGKTFSDVSTAYWGYPDIQKAYKLNLIIGDPQGTFRPLDNISYAEIVKILVSALGKNTNLQGEWPMNYINRAKEIGIVSIEDDFNVHRKVTRGEVSVLIWDTILAELD